MKIYFDNDFETIGLEISLFINRNIYANYKFSITFQLLSLSIDITFFNK